MARTYQRGRTHYSDILFPQHPQADKNGRLRIPLDTNKDYAQRKLSTLIEQRDAAKHNRPATHLTAWPEFKVKMMDFLKHLDHHTRFSYLRSMRLLEGVFPITEVKQVTPLMLDDLYLQWKTAGRGLYVRNKDMKCLKRMMRKAESWGLIGAQDWETVKLDPEPRGRLLFYEIEELRKILKEATGVWETMVYLGARAGLRRGEMLWLHIKDIDFGRNLLHIDGKPEHGWHIKNYETRAIPMTADLHKHLKAITADGREWVLQEGDWRPTVGSMTVYFSRVVRRAKLSGSLHTLRHTFGAHLAIEGRDLREIRDLMGHKSVKTTEIYAHLRPGAVTHAIASLPAL